MRCQPFDLGQVAGLAIGQQPDCGRGISHARAYRAYSPIVLAFANDKRIREPMLNNDAPSLDHLGWIGPDLAAGAAAWERLGFTLSRTSPQMGFTGPDGALEPWASANRCAVFEQGYLELIGIIAPERFNPWTAYLVRGAGAHIAAFRVGEADAAYPPLAARVDGFDAPVQRRRMAPLGLHEDGGEAEMRFRNIFSQDDHWPEGRYIVIEHQTPDILWQPDLLVHANGAKALVEALFAAPDPGPTRDRLARLANRPAVETPNGWRIDTDGGTLTIMTLAALDARFPGVDAPARPAVIGAVVGVEDLGAARAFMTANEIELESSSDGLEFTAGPDAAGGIIAFKQL
jgi:hypothetical protein